MATWDDFGFQHNDWEDIITFPAAGKRLFRWGEHLPAVGTALLTNKSWLTFTSPILLHLYAQTWGINGKNKSHESPQTVNENRSAEKKNKKQEYIKDTVNQIKWWHLLFHSAGILGLCQLKSVGIC